MTKEELILRISEAGESTRSKEDRERDRKIARFMRLYGIASDYCDEIDDLCEIVNFALYKGFRIQSSSRFMGSEPESDQPILMTDGIEHKLGFYRKGNGFCFRCVGIKNGGTRGEIDLTADGADIYWGNRSMREYDPDEMLYRTAYWDYAYGNLKQFVDEFPRFRDAVYHFIENIDSYKCYL